MAPARTVIAALLISAITGCTRVAAFLGIRPSAIPFGDYTLAVERANRLVRRSMRRRDIPGVVISLIDDQDVVWHCAYGTANLETGEAATVDTVFNAGSIVKLFTGIEVMRMYEEGSGRPRYTCCGPRP